MLPLHSPVTIGKPSLAAAGRAAPRRPFCRTRNNLERRGVGFAERISMPCHRWGCPYCQPGLQQALIAQTVEAQFQRIIGFTDRNGDPDTVAERHANFAEDIRRDKGPNAYEYHLFKHRHKDGSHHFHVAHRGCYLDWAYLKAKARKHGFSSVDIRAVAPEDRERRATYLVKGLCQFGTAKRHWHSKNWLRPGPKDRCRGAARAARRRHDGGGWKPVPQSLTGFVRASERRPGFVRRRTYAAWGVPPSRRQWFPRRRLPSLPPDDWTAADSLRAWNIPDTS